MDVNRFELMLKGDTLLKFIQNLWIVLDASSAFN